MTDICMLVDRQLRLSEIKRRLEQPRERIPQANIDEVQYGPCVLLSRQCGSAGDEVARLVGERLRWQVFDRQIVEQIAERTHVRNQLVESVDEHVRSRWRRLLHPIREREGLSPDAYLYHLHEIVLALGHRGYVVLEGRGAQFLLPGACAVRVRVVEPLADRVRRTSSTRHLSIDEATQFVQKCEKHRTEFIQKSFHQDTTAPLNYDLVLNTGYLRVEEAAAAVLAAVEKKLGIKVETVPCAT
jgi:hypothetical protein